MNVLKLSRNVGLIGFVFLMPNFSAAELSFDGGGYDSGENSLQIIRNGLIHDPYASHDAVLIFKKGLSSEELAVWERSRAVNILSLEGQFLVGNQDAGIMLGDLASYDAPLEEVIERQLTNYHLPAIDNIIADLNSKLLTEADQKKAHNTRKAISELSGSKGNTVFWTKAKVLATYIELDSLTSSSNVVSTVLVFKENYAELIDEQLNNPKEFQKSLNSIRPPATKELTGYYRYQFF